MVPKGTAHVIEESTAKATIEEKPMASASGIRPYIRTGSLYVALWLAFRTLAIGIPTDAILNPIFGRMTPVRAQDYSSCS